MENKLGKWYDDNTSKTLWQIREDLLHQGRHFTFCMFCCHHQHFYQCRCWYQHQQPTWTVTGQSGAKTSRKLESSKVSWKAWTPPKLEKKLELEQSVRKSVRATLPAADTELCHWRNSRTHTLERWWGRCWRWCDDSDLGKKQRIPYYIYFIKLGQSRPTAGKA